MSVHDNIVGQEASNSDNQARLDTDYLFLPFCLEKLPTEVRWRSSGYNHVKIVCDEYENFYAFDGVKMKVSKFNTVTNTWMKLYTTFEFPQQRPPRLFFPSVVIYEGRLIVVGGFTGYTWTEEVIKCDLQRRHWYPEKTTGPAAPSRYNNGAVVHEGNLYIIGAERGDALARNEYVLDIHKLDLRTSVWEELWSINDGTMTGHEPKTDIGRQVVVHGNKIILLGVQDYIPTRDLSSLPAFDLESRTWTCLNTIGQSSFLSNSYFPSFPICRTVVRRGDEVFLAGTTPAIGIWKLNLIDLQWTKMPHRLIDNIRIYDGALSPNGNLLVYCHPENESNNLSITRDAQFWRGWFGVPTLKEMAWEAVRHFQPNLKDEPRDQLRESGIPIDLLRRMEI